MAKKKATPEQVITALQNSNGLQAGAARALNVSRQTIANYIKNDPEIAAAYEQVNETTIDKVEGKLLENINNGNVVAQIFYLKTKAKHRGYVEKQELDLSNKDGTLAPMNDAERLARMKTLAQAIAEEIKKDA